MNAKEMFLEALKDGKDIEEAALTVRKIDPTIKKPIGDFLDEIEKVVENFKKRLHNESESDIINITDKQSR